METEAGFVLSIEIVYICSLHKYSQLAPKSSRFQVLQSERGLASADSVLTRLTAAELSADRQTSQFIPRARYLALC